MSDMIRQLAEQRRRRFESLPAVEKPKVSVCPDCGEATYKADVCPRTGLYHDREKKRLVGGSVVEGKVLNSAQLMVAIDSARVKWVASRTQLVRVDTQSLNIFQSFVAQLDWSLQRYGLLYGRYDEAAKAIEVHAVYEPEQHGTRYTFDYVDDARVPVVDGIARGLGLRRVGAVCTHPLRDPDACLLSSREMLLCAQEQSRFGDECVLLTVSPRQVVDSSSNVDPLISSVGGNNNGSNSDSEGIRIECQAWQTSPQCVHLFRLGLLHEPGQGGDGGGGGGASEAAATPVKKGHVSGCVGQPTRTVPVPTTANNSNNTAAAAADDNHSAPSPPPPPPPPMSAPEEARFLECGIELEVAQEERDRNGKQRILTKAPSTRIDTRWFTSYIAIQQFNSDVVRGLFMRVSRPGMAPPTFQNLKNYFNDPKRKSATFADKIADFHVLVFLAEHFSVKDDLPLLVEIARTRAMGEEAQTYEAILSASMQ